MYGNRSYESWASKEKTTILTESIRIVVFSFCFMCACVAQCRVWQTHRYNHQLSYDGKPWKHETAATLALRSTNLTTGKSDHFYRSLTGTCDKYVINYKGHISHFNLNHNDSSQGLKSLYRAAGPEPASGQSLAFIIRLQSNKLLRFQKVTTGFSPENDKNSFYLILNTTFTVWQCLF